jgi:hypothetical protein
MRHARSQVTDFDQRRFLCEGPGRIVEIAQDNEARPRRERSAHFVKINLESIFRAAIEP